MKTTSQFFVTHPLLLLLVFVLPALSSVAQQNAQFTQYMYDGLFLNPAYAGADEALSITFLNRSQWQGLEGSPSTQALSGHTLFRNENLGLGLAILNDKIGVHQNLLAYGSTAYHVKVTRDATFSLGLQVGINHRKADYLSLTGNTPSDPVIGAEISHTFLDFGFGVFYRSSRFQTGFSVPKLRTQKFEINDSTDIRFNNHQYFLFSKYRLTINENVEIEPGFLIKYLAEIPMSYDINTNIILKRVLSIGLSYRKSESLGLLIMAYVTPQLRLGYGYDHAVGRVREFSTGSHELMAGYLFKFSESKTVSPR